MVFCDFRALEQIPTAFFNLFMQINATFSKDSSDCIATLSSAAECIEFLVSLPDMSSLGPGMGSSTDGAESELPTMATLERTFTMNFDEVRNMLSWSLHEDVIAHPLNDLDILLCVRYLYAFLCSTAALVAMLLSSIFIVARCSRQLIGPTDWDLVTLGP